MERPLRVLVTGSSGLIGKRLSAALARSGVEVLRFDRQDDLRNDIRDSGALEAAADRVDGIVHLAAVSRVVWAQNNPELCRAVNMDGTDRVARLLRSSGGSAPWLLLASSREVYGQQDAMPVSEDAELRPMNVYAHSKVHSEGVAAALRVEGYCTGVLRFSNVYGCPDDHVDRVVPAFARVAAAGGRLRLEGADNVFDFTHVDDVVKAATLAVAKLAVGASFDPIHVVTGVGSSLNQLADIALRNARAAVVAEHHAPRNYDVARFYGAPERAARILGFTTRIALQDGFVDLVNRLAHRLGRA